MCVGVYVCDDLSCGNTLKETDRSSFLFLDTQQGAHSPLPPAAVSIFKCVCVCVCVCGRANKGADKSVFVRMCVCVRAMHSKVCLYICKSVPVSVCVCERER